MLTVTEENVLVNVEAKDKEEVIRILVDLLVKNGYVTPEYYDILIDREEKYPTGLPTEGVQVAIPHGVSEGCVLKPAVAMATLAHTVMFRNMAVKEEELSVGIVLLFGLPDEQDLAEDLCKVMSIFSESELLSRVYKAETASEIVKIMGALLK
ncbi:MAG: PTS sugar transporter subunit IIA [Treponema sp.]|jgi:PTS system galactitol-specific IIA component|nr:PTS sugar transporter subunit IIA [Treponema sp.]